MPIFLSSLFLMAPGLLSPSAANLFPKDIPLAFSMDYTS
jgi:hypothetical protein